MIIGKVKWFNNQKKYGFILLEDKEIFVHFSDILKEGYKTLRKGEMVLCDVVKTIRGEKAVKVRRFLVPKGLQTQLIKRINASTIHYSSPN